MGARIFNIRVEEEMNRSKKDWEEYCLETLYKDRVFTIWWATENKFIANAMDRLIENKRIRISNKNLTYPHSRAIIRNKK